MKQVDRERLVLALVHGVPRSQARVFRVLEVFATEDVDAIEPIIDRIIAREVAAASASRRTARDTSRMVESSPRRQRRGER